MNLVDVPNLKVHHHDTKEKMVDVTPVTDRQKKTCES